MRGDRRYNGADSSSAAGVLADNRKAYSIYRATRSSIAAKTRGAMAERRATRNKRERCSNKGQPAATRPRAVRLLVFRDRAEPQFSAIAEGAGAERLAVYARSLAVRSKSSLPRCVEPKSSVLIRMPPGRGSRCLRCAKGKLIQQAPSVSSRRLGRGRRRATWGMKAPAENSTIGVKPKRTAIAAASRNASKPAVFRPENSSAASSRSSRASPVPFNETLTDTSTVQAPHQNSDRPPPGSMCRTTGSLSGAPISSIAASC
jgi:hypothetical protein